MNELNHDTPKPTDGDAGTSDPGEAKSSQTLRALSSSQPWVLRRTAAVWFSGVIALNTALGVWLYISQQLQWSAWLYAGLALISVLTVYIAVYLGALKRHRDILLAEVNQLQGQLEHRLRHGRVTVGDDTYLVLGVDTHTGALEYETERNALFNVRTIQLIMGEIARLSGAESLREIGKLVGRTFAQRSFAEYLNHKRREGTQPHFDELLDTWCDYDTDAGFGRFENRTHFMEDSQQYGGQIYLVDSFLTFERAGESSELCSFMEGYIEGVLEIVAAKKGKILHVSHVQCGTESALPQVGCHFAVSYRDVPNDPTPEKG